MSVMTASDAMEKHLNKVQTQRTQPSNKKNATKHGIVVSCHSYNHLGSMRLFWTRYKKCYANNAKQNNPERPWVKVQRLLSTEKPRERLLMVMMVMCFFIILFVMCVCVYRSTVLITKSSLLTHSEKDAISETVCAFHSFTLMSR